MKEDQEEEQKQESKITNVEWGLVIGALFTIDLIQIVIEWLMSWWGLGIILNWIIDLFVGMSLALYLQMRGQSMANPKRLLGLTATFVAELIPVIDELPLWGLDGIFNMVISKSDKILSKIPGGSIVSESLERANSGIVSVDNRSITRKINDSARQIREANEAVKNQRNTEE